MSFIKNTTTEDSLGKRYTSKLLSNFVGLVVALLIGAIIPRALGPKDYGDFSFLTNFFIQCLPLLTFSTSVGFYTKLSQRQKEFGLISFYWRINIFAFLLLFVFVFIAQSANIASLIWPNQNIDFIIMAVIYASLVWSINTLTQMADAQGLTVPIEIAKTLQKLIGLLVVLVLFFTNSLTLLTYYFYNYFIFFLLIVAYLLIIHRSEYSFISYWKLTKSQLTKYLKEFYDYSRPLFSYAIIGLFVGLFDRWFLQKYGGSVQQGFFSLALQVGALCFLFTGSMSSLITREFSVAFKQNNLVEMKRLFRKFVPLLYSISAFFGCFIAVEANVFVNIFGGSEYKNAVLPMIIMAFYPIHQTYGQLSGSVFYATGQTRIYSYIGVTFMLLGLPLVYFSIAPVYLYGFNLGATGLAIKLVLVQFIAVNVQLYYNSKFLNLSFFKYLAHQFISVILLVTLAVIAKYLTSYLFLNPDNELLTFLISGLLYSFLVILITYIYPQIFGLYKKDIHYLRTKLGKLFKNKIIKD